MHRRCLPTQCCFAGHVRLETFSLLRETEVSNMWSELKMQAINLREPAQKACRAWHFNSKFSLELDILMVNLAMCHWKAL